MQPKKRHARRREAKTKAANPGKPANTNTKRRKPKANTKLRSNRKRAAKPNQARSKPRNPKKQRPKKRPLKPHPKKPRRKPAAASPRADSELHLAIARTTSAAGGRRCGCRRRRSATGSRQLW